MSQYDYRPVTAQPGSGDFRINSSGIDCLSRVDGVRLNQVWSDIRIK